MSFKVSGSGAENALVIAKLARHQTTVAQFTDADCGIEAFADQVDKTLRVLGFHRHLREGQGKLGEHRAEPEPAHGRGQRQAQAASDLNGALGGFAFGVTDQAGGML
ncbi:hypothetical protein D3C80_1432830 [compost metagenome]